MPETVDPQTTASRAFLSDPAFPVRRHHPRPVEDVPAAVRRRVGHRGNGKSVLRASAGIYSARQNMLSQVGTVTTNGLQQQTHLLEHREHDRVRRRRRRRGPAC